MAKQYLGLARAFVRILEASITEEASCRVLLLPEMVERIAEMLNYFLDLLIGKQRQQLKVGKEHQRSGCGTRPRVEQGHTLNTATCQAGPRIDIGLLVAIGHLSCRGHM